MSRGFGAVRVAWSCALLGWFLASCGGSQRNAEDERALAAAREGVQHTLCDFRGHADRVEVLTQGRGARAANVRRVYAVGDERDGRRILRCREVDTNLDGKKDVVRLYDERGEPLSEQADTNYDGKMDTFLEFASGAVTHAEIDHNRDGKPDEFRTYSDGQLARVQRDSSFDGQLDVWEVYERGRLRRIGRDTDGDERVDSWYRHHVAEPEAPNAVPTASAPSAAPGAGSSAAPPASPPAPTSPPSPAP